MVFYLNNFFDKIYRNNFTAKNHQKNRKFSSFTLSKIFIDYKTFCSQNKKLKTLLLIEIIFESFCNFKV